jgi:hypothetical protein
MSGMTSPRSFEVPWGPFVRGLRLARNISPKFGDLPLGIRAAEGS